MERIICVLEKGHSIVESSLEKDNKFPKNHSQRKLVSRETKICSSDDRNYKETTFWIFVRTCVITYLRTNTCPFCEVVQSTHILPLSTEVLPESQNGSRGQEHSWKEVGSSASVPTSVLRTLKGINLVSKTAKEYTTSENTTTRWKSTDSNFQKSVRF